LLDSTKVILCYRDQRRFADLPTHFISGGKEGAPTCRVHWGPSTTLKCFHEEAWLPCRQKQSGIVRAAAVMTGAGMQHLQSFFAEDGEMQLLFESMPSETSFLVPGTSTTHIPSVHEPGRTPRSDNISNLPPAPQLQSSDMSRSLSLRINLWRRAVPQRGSNCGPWPAHIKGLWGPIGDSKSCTALLLAQTESHLTRRFFEIMLRQMCSVDVFIRPVSRTTDVLNEAMRGWLALSPLLPGIL